MGDSEEYDDGERDDDGEAGSPNVKKKKKVDWRHRRETRLKKEAKEKKKEKNSFDPSFQLGRGIGLEIPAPIVYMLTAGGLGVMGYIIYLVMIIPEQEKKKQE